MGCVQSKSSSSSHSPDNDECPKTLETLSPSKDISNSTNNVSGDALIDPRMPLTAREVFKLKSSWKAIHRNITETSIEMFISVFQRDAELMNYFIKIGGFENGEITNMRENSKLLSHAEGVMKVLDTAIINISDVDKVLNLLHYTARTHLRFGDFLGKLFWAFEEAFLEAVHLTLDDRYSEYMESIYKKTIKFVLSELEKGFNSVKE